MFTFDSFEDMQQHLAERADQAFAGLTMEQRAIDGGMYVMLPTESFIIFGFVFTPEEVYASERACGADEEEARDTERQTRTRLASGMLYGRWWSIAEPGGELGSNHAANCWPITRHEFQVAQNHEWDSRVIIRADNGAWLVERYIDMATATAHRRPR